MDVLIPLILPLITAALIQVLGRVASPNVRDGAHTFMAMVTFYYVTRLIDPVMAGDNPDFFVAEMFPGLSLSFSVEPLGLMFALVASGLWIPTSVYAFGYMRGHHESNQTRFFTCFALAIGFALGVAFGQFTDAVLLL